VFICVICGNRVFISRRQTSESVAKISGRSEEKK